MLLSIIMAQLLVVASSQQSAAVTNSVMQRSLDINNAIRVVRVVRVVRFDQLVQMEAGEGRQRGDRGGRVGRGGAGRGKGQGVSGSSCLNNPFSSRDLPPVSSVSTLVPTKIDTLYSLRMHNSRVPTDLTQTKPTNQLIAFSFVPLYRRAGVRACDIPT